MGSTNEPWKGRTVRAYEFECGVDYRDILRWLFCLERPRGNIVGVNDTGVAFFHKSYSSSVVFVSTSRLRRGLAFLDRED